VDLVTRIEDSSLLVLATVLHPCCKCSSHVKTMTILMKAALGINGDAIYQG
jgi:hypothetical protein